MYKIDVEMQYSLIEGKLFRESHQVLYGVLSINVAPSGERVDGKKLYEAVQEKPHAL